MDLACSEDGETKLLQKLLMKPTAGCVRTWGGQNCIKTVFKREVLGLGLLQGSYTDSVRDSLGYYTRGNYS